MPESKSLTVGKLGESGLLARILPRLQGSEALVGPGDDAALIAAPNGSFVFTVDTLVENQDFRLRWPSGFESSGFDVGWKSAAQNLSDINAMGAYATAAVISLTLPHETPVQWVEDLADGFSAAVHELGATRCAIAGGDLGRGSELSITAAVTGALAMEKPVLRSGAKPGDIVAANGVLGVAAAGLALLDSNISVETWSKEQQELVLGQRRPRPPLEAGPLAARSGVSAMMDISDGLFKDAKRLAISSDVAIEIHQEALSEDIELLIPFAQLLGVDPLNWVISGGEDHGLLATFPPRAPLPEGFRAVGIVHTADTSESKERVSLDGANLSISAGFDHFGD